MSNKKSNVRLFDKLYLVKVINELSNKKIDLENYEEINVEEMDLGFPVPEVDIVFKGIDKIFIYEFLSMEDPIQDLRRVLACLAVLSCEYDMDVEANVITPPDFDEELELEYSPGEFFKPGVINLGNSNGDRLLRKMCDKLENENLTLEESIKMSIIPLMGSYNRLTSQIRGVLEIMDDSNMDPVFKEQILNINVFIMTKFVDKDSQLGIIRVNGDDRSFLIII